MKRFLRLSVPVILFTLIIIFLFKKWFLPGILTGGDLPYYFPQLMRSVPFLSSWDIRDMGMGSSMLPTLWLELYASATLRVFSFLSWDTYVRFAWFFPFLLCATLSSYFLSKKYFVNGFFNFLTPLLYVCNTYALLLVGGGQMGIALSYASAPFGILAFEDFLEKLTVQSTILFSLTFSLIFLLDIRIGYILVWVLGIRFLFELISLTKEKIKKYLSLFSLSAFIIAGLHAFWLLPTLLTHGSAISQFGGIYTSAGAVKFFSFATLEDALGLLHPDWPENLFGLTHFMRPEFLLLPILAYGSLLFIKSSNSLLSFKKETKYILFFALLGLVGAFLAKGANDPFGAIYLWLFAHIPGFIMFRDPTKWYLLIATSYSILIPFSLYKIYRFLSGKQVFLTSHLSDKFIEGFRYIFLLLILCYFAFLIRPAIMGQLGGTFKPHILPQDYIKLESFLDSQENFSRTLWIPSVDRFGFYSYAHPAVAAEGFFSTATLSGSIEFLHSPETEQALREAAIRYVIVPNDSEGEIFLKDRVYNQKLYDETVANVQSVPWLHELSGFGKIHVFAVQKTKDHFWIDDEKGISSYVFKTPTEYAVTVKNVAKGDMLIFAENYDSGWIAKLNKTTVVDSKIFHGRLNGFQLPQNGSYALIVSYQPQQWVSIGLWISLLTGFVVIVSLVWFIKTNVLK